MKNDKKILAFVVYMLALCVAWFLLYDVWLNTFDNWLTVKLAEASTALLRFVGCSAQTFDSAIYINETRLVYIGPSCNGMVLMALFAGFIMAFPGPLAIKLVYIPMGIIAINILNILRVSALALNALYSQHTLDFNHKYTFTIVVYTFIFASWMFWVKRFATLTNHGTSSSHGTAPKH